VGKTICERTSLLPRSCAVSGHLPAVGVSLLTCGLPATGKGSLTDAIPPIRGRRGRPRRRPRELFADRGYDHDIYRRQLRARGITPRIARRGIAHGSGLGRQRWVVERSFAWLHAFKRLRTRYERRADIHLGLLQLACALICYRQLTVLLK
jgi:transposase